MAVNNHHQPPLFTLILTMLASLIALTTQTDALNCASSQKFTNNNLYTHCTDLHTLNSTLHYTYTNKTSSLQVAFIAPPVHPQGWIAWAINPTHARMAGSQAFIAFHDENNATMIVKTYNISSYSGVTEGDIAFDVKDMKSEYSDGMMRIYVTVKLPETMKEVNHVWQVGGEVVKGVPVRHAFTAENLKATAKLNFLSADNDGSPVVAPSPSASDAYRNNVMCVFLVVVILGIMMS
ncbi:DOMON domain-containing protein [Artemisia annua]|uniref:DOMON domain-containing protein n=1 Tax=Artemisia annua TaxID=35608 RepID=A0A2U1KU44_ARTAN|nr:DOMON domain-containing protein [Artemisia annua]